MGFDPAHQDGAFAVLRWTKQKAVRTISMFAADEFGFRRAGLQSQALGTCRYRPFKVHFDFRAQTPDVIPPRIAWVRAQRAPLLAFGGRPRHPRCATQFAMRFRLIVVLAQLVDRGIGGRQRLDAFDIGDERGRRREVGRHEPRLAVCVVLADADVDAQRRVELAAPDVVAQWRQQRRQ